MMNMNHEPQLDMDYWTHSIVRHWTPKFFVEDEPLLVGKGSMMEFFWLVKRDSLSDFAAIAFSKFAIFIAILANFISPS